MYPELIPSTIGADKSNPAPHTSSVPWPAAFMYVGKLAVNPPWSVIAILISGLAL